MTKHSIGPGMRVTLNFSLSLKDGVMVDSTFDKAPASLQIGDGNLPEGFESYLVGLEAGAHERFDVPPERAFGQANPSNRQSFKRSDFDRDMVLEPGLMVSFADAQQSELPGVIRSVEADEVVVDFNHPLAGQALIFEVQIIDVQPVQ